MGDKATQRGSGNSKHARLDKFQEDVIIAHNKFRGKHNSAPLKWSAGLAEGARHWAVALAEKCIVKHSNQLSVGENIWSGEDLNMTGTQLTQMWYNEIENYDFETPGFNTKTRNFTQIVWRDTTSIGVAKAQSKNGILVVVARYYPSANILGKFEQNVLECTDVAATDIIPRPLAQVKEDLKNELLKAHNRYRKKHGVPLLQWSEELAEGAKFWAEELGRRKEVRSLGSPEYGENIIVVEGQNISGGVATDLWYDEIKNYNFREPLLNSKTGHFTQIVWASTRFIGAAKIISHDGRCVVIARYLPPGNIKEDLRNNVKQTRTISQTDLPGHNRDVFTCSPVPKEMEVERNNSISPKVPRKHNRKATCNLQ